MSASLAESTHFMTKQQEQAIATRNAQLYSAQETLREVVALAMANLTTANEAITLSADGAQSMAKEQLCELLQDRLEEVVSGREVYQY